MNTILRGLVVAVALLVTLDSGLAVAARRDYPMELSATVVLDQATHLYTFSYSVANPSSNPAALDVVVVNIQAGVDVVTDIKAPQGWSSFYSADLGRIMWAATGFINADEEGDPGGDISQSDYAVIPGGRLSGFGFKSFSPPGTGLAITQTFAPLPAAATEEEAEDLVLDPSASRLPDDNGYRIQTTTPMPVADWSGNRRPAVDGFLVFANLTDKSSFQGQALIVFRLAAGGEIVDPATLKIELNGADVTSRFSYDETYKGYAATFAPGSSPVVVGKNILLTAIQGTIPGRIDQPTWDTDRVTFTLLP